jgi:serine/threonine-protein kinase
MLTGSVPFDGPSDKICLDHWKTQPLAPSFLNPSIPRSVERVILGALEKDPRRRYQTVEDLLRAFLRTHLIAMAGNMAEAARLPLS